MLKNNTTTFHAQLWNPLVACHLHSSKRKEKNCGISIISEESRILHVLAYNREIKLSFRAHEREKPNNRKETKSKSHHQAEMRPWIVETKPSSETTVCK
jgi:hypothetical protein